jgi:hypothetical protein
MDNIDDLYADAEEDTVVEIDTSDTAFDEYLTAFHRLRTDKSTLEESLKQINKELADIEAALVHTMQTRNIQTIKKPGMGAFTLTANPWPKVLDMDKMVEWLESHGHAGLAKWSVNAQTLRAWVKDQKIAGNDIPPPEIMEDRSGFNVRFTKAR